MDVGELMSLLYYSSPLMEGASVQCVQGCKIRFFPGCVKLGKKVAFCLPTAGRRTQFFHPKFTQPGKGLIVQPCNVKAPHSDHSSLNPGWSARNVDFPSFSVGIRVSHWANVLLLFSPATQATQCSRPHSGAVAVGTA